MDDVVLLAVDEPLDRSVVAVEFVDDLLWIERRVEGVVDRVDRVADVRLGVLEQVGDLGADQGAHRADERRDREQHSEQDQRGRTAPPPTAPAVEPIDTRLDRQRQEQRDEDQEAEAGQPVPDPPQHGDGDVADPEEGDRPNHPGWNPLRPVGAGPVDGGPPAGRLGEFPGDGVVVRRIGQEGRIRRHAKRA